MRFCYHPDNSIYNDSGYVSSYEEFIASNPDFPLVEGEFFEYKNGTLFLINSEGHNIPQESGYENLITAINGL